MKHISLSRFFLLFFFCLCSCQKGVSLDIVDNAEYQRVLCSKLERREQVISARADKDGLIIVFNDKKEFRVSGSSIPIITAQKQFWLINGINTGIVVRYDSQGRLIVPEVVRGQNGNWLIDNEDTKYPIDNSYYNSISSRDEGIVSVALIKKSLYFFLKDGGVLFASIIDDESFVVPIYYFDHLVQKEKIAETLLKQSVGGHASFVFFTDAHWERNQKHSPSLIKHIIDYTPFNKVFFGGDALTFRQDDPMDALVTGYEFQNAFSFLGSDFYCVIGNHDDNSSGQPNDIEKHLTENQVYSFLQSQMKSVNNIGYNFFFDDPDNLTRYLCLDTGRLYFNKFRSYSFQTAQFIIEVLKTVPANWHVIVISHIWCNLVNQESGQCKESSYVRPLIKILEDYNSRSSGVFSFNGNSILYDFRISGGRIDYCIGGHTHADSIVMSEGGIPLIIITSDGQSEVAGPQSITRTISEQCVVMVVTDYERRKLHVIHVGRGDDISIDI